MRDWFGDGRSGQRRPTTPRTSTRYKARLDELDAHDPAGVATVPAENRKLLTYHDSWAYWAREYGFTVIGAVQASDFSDPSPQEVAGSIDQIRAEKVPAVFGSEVFPSPVLEQIARESGAHVRRQAARRRAAGRPGRAGAHLPRACSRTTCR